MNTPQVLWKQYHQAIKDGNQPLAQTILKKIQNLRTYPHTPSGCGSCRKRFG